MKRIKTFIELIRPANVITALSDVIAGMAIVGFTFGIVNYQVIPLLLLGFSSMCLYAGGIVFNDVFDFKLDQIERPERALPSGRMSLSKAIISGSMFLVAGMILAFTQSILSGILAVIIVVFVLLYNWKAKHHVVMGPLTMGLCRGFNLLLGMSVYEFEFVSFSHLMFLPVLYIAGITLISRGEVHGSKKWPMMVAFLFFLFIQLGQLHFSFQHHKLYYTLPFVLLHAYLIYPSLFKAMNNPIGPLIGKAVKAGVLSLIVMNAAWASIGEQWIVAIFVLCLLLVSKYLAKLFAVT